MKKRIKIKILIPFLIVIIFTFLVLDDVCYSQEVKKTVLKVKFWESWKQTAAFGDGLIEFPHYYYINNNQTIKGKLGKDGFYVYELYLGFPQVIKIGGYRILISPTDTITIDYTRIHTFNQPKNDFINNNFITSKGDTTIWHFYELDWNLQQYKLLGIIPSSAHYKALSPKQFEQRIDSFYQAGTEYIKKYFDQNKHLVDFYKYYAKCDLLFRVARECNFYYNFNIVGPPGTLETSKISTIPKDFFKYNDSISKTFNQLYISFWSDMFFNDYCILFSINKTIKDDYESKLNYIFNSTTGLIRDIVIGRTISNYQLRKFQEKYLPISLRFANKIENDQLRLALLSRINEMKSSQNNLKKEVSDKQPKSLNELLENYHNKVVYVEFWATWCGPCLEDAEYLDDLNRQIRNENFKILNICVNSPKLVWEKHISTKNHFGDHIYLSDQAFKYLSKEISVPHFPYYLLVDQKRNTMVKDAPRPYLGKDSKINEELTNMINKMLTN